MQEKLKNIKNIIIAQEFESGGIIDRANKIVDKSSTDEKSVSEMVVGSRHKKKGSKTKAKRKKT